MCYKIILAYHLRSITLLGCVDSPNQYNALRRFKLGRETRAFSPFRPRTHARVMAVRCDINVFIDI